MRGWLVTAVLLAAAALLVAGLWIARPGSPPKFIDYYGILDEDSIVIGTLTGDGDEIRVTDVNQTADTVTITVQTFTFIFGPRADIGRPIELLVDLDRPLGDRQVWDPYHEVPRVDTRPSR
jgi:hypothetical protein